MSNSKAFPGGVPREVLRQRETQVWDLRQAGMTHERIALEMNMERSTITKMLSRLSNRANATIMSEMVSEKISQITRLNFIVDEAMQAWSRSKEASKTVRKQQSDPVKEEETAEATAFRRRGRSAGESRTVVVSQVQDNDGDPRYLDTAMRAMADIRKVMGLDAPNRNLNINLETLSDSQLERLAAGEDVFNVMAGGSEVI